MFGVLLCFVTLDTYFYIQYCYTILLHEKSFHQAPTHTEQLERGFQSSNVEYKYLVAPLIVVFLIL